MSLDSAADGDAARSVDEADGTDDREVVLEAEELRKHFSQSDSIVDRLLGAGGTVRAVDGVDLSLRSGETLAVVGESGCGKSTLGQALLNLHEPTGGTVRYRGEDITGLSGREMRPYRSELQMIFQDPLASLNPRQTVGEILTAPMEVHGEPSTDPTVETTAEVTVDGAVSGPVSVTVDDDVDRAVGTTDGVAVVDVTVRLDEEGDGVSVDLGEAGSVLGSTVDSTGDGHDVRVSIDASVDRVRRHRAGSLLERVGLERGHLDRYPAQFSGGQQQRVGIARALSVEPDVIVADEPVSALDVSVQAQILQLLQDLQDEFDLALLFITHDLSVVRHVADRVAVMYLGEIVETSRTDELFETQHHPYSEALLSAVPRIDPEQRGGRIVLQGNVPSPIDPPEGCRFHTRCHRVIPPADWPGDQSAFRRAFTFRNRVEAGEVDPDAARRRLDAEGEATDADAVAEHLVSAALPGETGELPAAAREAVLEAARLVVEGEEAAAIDRLAEAFPSPCIDRTPRTVEPAPDRTSACHRVDPDAPGEPTIGD